MASDRAERREKNLEALKRASVIIDLTNEGTSPSSTAARSQTKAPGKRRSPAKHRADLEALKRPPVTDLTDDDSPLAHRNRLSEPLLVHPTFLNLALKDGRCTNENGRIDLHSVVEVVLKPGNGYPVSFRFFRDSQDGFTGKYGEDGTGIISLDLKDVEGMIQQEPRVGGVLAYIWSPE